jgi:hypothetical protein
MSKEFLLINIQFIMFLTLHEYIVLFKHLIQRPFHSIVSCWMAQVVKYLKVNANSRLCIPYYCWPVLKPYAAFLLGSFQNIRSFFYAVSDNYFIMIFHIDDIPLSLYMLQTYCCSWTNAISFSGICNIPSHTWLLSHGYNNIVSGFFAVYLYPFKPVARGVCPIYEWSMRSVSRQGCITTTPWLNGWSQIPHYTLFKQFRFA